MFHGERIVSIGATDKVLEIGPGSQPFPRSDVFLDKSFTEEEAFEQSGFIKPADVQGKPHYFYDGKKFPFGDHEFNYAICSHVIEHVPVEDLHLFISELQRVATRGYLEFPNVFYELINFQPVHQWMMNYRDGEILFLDKFKFHTNNIHQIYRRIFYGKDTYLKRIFQRYKDFFFVGFEWQDTIRYRIVDSFDELVNAQDLAQWSKYFDEFQALPPLSKMNPFERYSRAFLRRVIKFVQKIGLAPSKSRGFVHQTVIFHYSENIHIHPTAQIREYVVLQASGAIEIGENSQVNPFVAIYAGEHGVRIGSNVMIAPHVMIAGGNHKFKQVGKPMRFAGSISNGPVIIENDVWIGANSVITDAVHIGEGAVVGAGAIVTKNVEPYEIVVGNPAHGIGSRKDSK